MCQRLYPMLLKTVPPHLKNVRSYAVTIWKKLCIFGHSPVSIFLMMAASVSDCYSMLFSAPSDSERASPGVSDSLEVTAEPIKIQPQKMGLFVVTCTV